MYEPADEHAQPHVSVSEAREDFAELVNRAAYAGERIRIYRRGRPVAAIVPIEDADYMERLEDEFDLKAAEEALADPENAVSYSLAEVEAELELER